MAKKVKKKELGMGIAALLRDMDAEATQEVQEKVVKELSHSVAMIPLSEIEVNPFQPRKEFDAPSLEELAESLKVHGLIQPLTLRRLADKQYQIISGERRLRAAKIAGLEKLPSYIRLANDQEMLEMALVENIQREDLNAIEIAITYQRLIDECKLTHENLSGRVGKKRSTVSNFLRLLKLPPDIQKGLKERKISMGHARALLGLSDYAYQMSLFHQIIKDGLSVRETEKRVQDYNEPKAKKRGGNQGLPGDYEKVQQNFRSFFGSGKIQLKLKKDGKGQIVIPFNSVKELNQFIEALEE